MKFDDGGREVTVIVTGGMKILIIEDQTMIRQLLTLACQQALDGSASILGAATGADGLAQCRNENPDLVVLDLALPDGDGLSLVPGIREACPGAKVLVLSSHMDEFTVHRVQQSGVHGFIDKNGQTLTILQEGLRALTEGRPYYCTAVQAMRARMRADPVSFAKVLSDREMELVVLFGRGLTNEQIAGQLGLRPNTVRNHRQNIMTKLGLGSTPQLIRYALEKGFTWTGT